MQLNDDWIIFCMYRVEQCVLELIDIAVLRISNIGFMVI